MRLYRPYLNKNVFIVGTKWLDITFYTLIVITFAVVMGWVIANDGHIKIDNYSHSTVVLQTQEAIETNYSSEDFNTTYVKPIEFQNYNRVWGRNEIVRVFPNEIHFITNMVITANQTQGVCPDNPMIKNKSCDPKDIQKNKCRKGFRSSNGVETGNCVKADFPLNYTFQLNNGYACEVDRYLPPLNEYRPILYKTINSSLFIDNSVEFPNYNIVINNLRDKVCVYDPVTKPDCVTFKVRDIIKYAKNSNESYEDLAKFGATFNINIVWNCFWNIFYSKVDECKPSYSFNRVGVWGNGGQRIYYSDAYYDSLGNKRTFIKSFRIRFAVNVKATMSQFDFFRFFTYFMAYTSAFTLMYYLFRCFARFMYSCIEFDEVVDATHLRHRFNKNPEQINPPYINHINDEQVNLNN